TGSSGEAAAYPRGEYGGSLWRQGQAHLSARLSGACKPRTANRIRCIGGKPDSRRRKGGYIISADDGCRRLLVHVERSARRIHLGRQRRRRRAASPIL